MTDIVECLETYANAEIVPVASLGVRRSMREAADEIERLRAERDEVRAILAHTDIGSLPNDYPLARVAVDRMGRIKELTLEGLALIGRIENTRSDALEEAAKLVEAAQLEDGTFAYDAPSYVIENLAAAIRALKAASP